MQKQTVLKVHQLTVNYDKISVLWDISFSVLNGELVGIIGPNGAGKSTLLTSILGITKPLSGKILFFDAPFEKVKKRIAYVPQRRSIDWDFPITVFDAVLMGRYSHLNWIKWYGKRDREKATETLKILGLDHLANRQISQLSGGQQQRLFVARALMQEADFYILDEPFAGVDMGTEKLIIDILKKLKGEGKTLLIVHHDLNSVESYFDSLLILNTSLVAYGSVKDVFTKENLIQAFGQKGTLFVEALKLSHEKSKGFS